MRRRFPGYRSSWRCPDPGGRLTVLLALQAMLLACDTPVDVGTDDSYAAVVVALEAAEESGEPVGGAGVSYVIMADPGNGQLNWAGTLGTTDDEGRVRGTASLPQQPTDLVAAIMLLVRPQPSDGLAPDSIRVQNVLLRSSTSGSEVDTLSVGVVLGPG